MRRNSPPYWIDKYKDIYITIHALENAHVCYTENLLIDRTTVRFSLYLTREFVCFVSKYLGVTSFPPPSTYFVLTLQACSGDSTERESCKLDLYCDTKCRFDIEPRNVGTQLRTFWSFEETFKKLEDTIDILNNLRLEYEYVPGLIRAMGKTDYIKRRESLLQSLDKDISNG